MNRREYIYVGNVHKSVNEQELKEYFWKAGKALKVYFMREYMQGSPTKIAFIQFETENQAKNACVMDQSVLKGCRLVVMLADEERYFQADCTIVARNLSADTTESNVYDLFRKFGALIDVAIPHGSFAYVGFREKAVAERVANNPNVYLKGNRLTIQVLQRDIPIRLESLDTLKTELDMTNKPPQVNSVPPRNHQASPSNYMEEMIPVAPPPPIIRGFMTSPSPPKINRLEYTEQEELKEYFMPLQAVHFEDMRFKIDSSEPLLYEYTIVVENIPREVTEDEIYDHFVKFGEIYHMKFTPAWNCAFSKNAQIIYNNQEAFLNSRDFFVQPFRDSYLFVTRLREFLDLDPRKTIILEFDVDHITFDDVRNALQEAGDVVYWTRSCENKYDTFVVFRGFVNYDRLRTKYDISGEEVHVMRYEPNIQRNSRNAVMRKLSDMTENDINNQFLREKFTRFENLKNFDLNGYCIASLDRQPLSTKFNPGYMNPDPVKFNNEVQVNCSKRNITLGDLRRYFQGAGDVITFRFRESEFSDTWTLFVSFSNYIQAKKACRIRGSFMGHHVFKHMANEKVNIDNERTYFFEAVPISADVAQLVSNGRLIITEQQIYARCVGMNAIDYIEKKSRLTAVIMFTKPLNEKKKIIKMGQFDGRLSFFKEYAQEAVERMLVDEMVEMQKFAVSRQEPQFNPYVPNYPIPPMPTTIPQPGSTMNDIFADDEIEPNKFEIYARNPQFCPPISQFISIFNSGDDNEAPREPSRSKRSFSREREQFRNRSRTKSRSRSRSIPTRRVRTPSPPRAKDLAKLEAAIREKEMALKRRLEELDKKLGETNKRNHNNQDDENNKRKRRSRSRGAKDDYTRRSRERDNRRNSRDRDNQKPILMSSSKEPKRRSRSREMNNRPVIMGGREIGSRSRSRVKEVLNRGRSQVRRGSNGRDQGIPTKKPSQEGISRESGIHIKEREREVRKREMDREAGPRDNIRNIRKSRSKSRGEKRSRRRSTSFEFEDLLRRKELMEDECNHLKESRLPKPWEKDRIIYLSSKLVQMEERQKQLIERIQNDLQPNSKKRVSPKRRDPSVKNHMERWIFIGNIVGSIKKNDLQTIFERFGRVLHIDLSFSRQNHTEEAYIQFESAESAKNAINEMHQYLFNKRRWRVSPRSKKPENLTGYTVTVTFKNQVQEEDLYNRYEEFGKIDFVWLSNSPEARFATVRFKNKESVGPALKVASLFTGQSVETKLKKYGY